MSQGHPTSDPTTCPHGVLYENECNDCWADHRARVDAQSSKERSQFTVGAYGEPRVKLEVPLQVGHVLQSSGYPVVRTYPGGKAKAEVAWFVSNEEAVAYAVYRNCNPPDGPFSGRPEPEVMEFLRSFISGSQSQDFRPWAQQVYRHLYGIDPPPSASIAHETSLDCSHCGGEGEAPACCGCPDVDGAGQQVCCGMPEPANCATCNGTGKIVSAAQYIKTLPADWHQDSSLEKWFPTTAEELVRLKAGSQVETNGDAADAARWRALPAFLEEFQIDYVGLLRAVDEYNAEKTASETPARRLHGIGYSHTLCGYGIREGGPDGELIATFKHEADALAYAGSPLKTGGSHGTD